MVQNTSELYCKNANREREEPKARSRCFRAENKAKRICEKKRECLCTETRSAGLSSADCSTSLSCVVLHSVDPLEGMRCQTANGLTDALCGPCKHTHTQQRSPYQGLWTDRGKEEVTSFFFFNLRGSYGHSARTFYQSQIIVFNKKELLFNNDVSGCMVR